MSPSRLQSSSLTGVDFATVSDASSSSSEDAHKELGRPASEDRTADHSKNKDSLDTALTSKGFRRHFAQHNYHDYSRVTPDQLDASIFKTSRGGVHTPFPLLLHKVLENADADGYSDIVSWQAHGRAFLIHDTKQFVAKVLPLHFKHSKMSSFQRQLSLYGFNRLTQNGPDRGAYYHECFLRSRAFLCSKIRRTRIKGTWIRKSSSPDSEPSFCVMEPVGDACSAPQTVAEPTQPQKYSPPVQMGHPSLLDVAAAARRYQDEHNKTTHFHASGQYGNSQVDRVSRPDPVHSTYTQAPYRSNGMVLQGKPLHPPPVHMVSVPTMIRVHDEPASVYRTTEKLTLPLEPPARTMQLSRPTPYYMNGPNTTTTATLHNVPDAIQQALEEIDDSGSILTDIDMANDCFNMENIFAI